MPKWLKLDPGAVGAAVAAVYVAGAMVYRAVDHTGVFAPDEVVAAFYAIYQLWSRTKTTALARPRNAAGQALVPAQQPGPVPATPVQRPPAPPAV